MNLSFSHMAGFAGARNANNVLMLTACEWDISLTQINFAKPKSGYAHVRTKV